MKRGIVLLFVVAGLFLVTTAAVAQSPKSSFKTPKGFALIPSGQVTIDTSKYIVQSFYISTCEITNQQYCAFLYELRNKGDMVSYQTATIDSSKWRDKNSYNEPYVEYYLRHPAYFKYPVVNVPYDGALLYCKWLSEKLCLEHPGYIIECRLPTRAEWICAARGGNAGAVYSGGNGIYLLGEKGQCQYNFKNIGAEAIHYNVETRTYEVVRDNAPFLMSDNADVTAPVTSYLANAYGLYNMCGNVSELLYEKGIAAGGGWNSTGYDIRVESTTKVDGPSPFVGFRPVFMVVMKPE